MAPHSHVLALLIDSSHQLTEEDLLVQADPILAHALPDHAHLVVHPMLGEMTAARRASSLFLSKSLMHVLRLRKKK
jgi:hypothetical protein